MPIILRLSEPLASRNRQLPICQPPRPGGARSGRVFEAVAKTADGRDDIGTQFLADTRDKYLDRVRIAVEILIVDMFDQLGPRNDLCLLYTSDAADDLLCVDLGGRRIIKKKTKKYAKKQRFNKSTTNSK